MTGFSKNRFTLASIGLAVGVAMGASTLQGCGENGLCGPCGSVVNGSVGISGNAQLDGFFSAVADIGSVTGSIQAEFDANIRALAEVWGYGEIEGAVNAQVVGEVMAYIKADITAQLDLNGGGGIAINYAGPKCSANVNVAVDAQAKCEASAGCECDVMVDPGEVSVECSGTCSGGCSAECSGDVACNAAAQGGISCEGSCEGSCSLEAAASCEGTCNGECSGNCSVENSDGSCAGECDAMCTGTCELSAGGNCEGTCSGTCTGTAPSITADCMAEVECRGECSGECSGSCEGSARPPMASADCECEASADCQASASAKADANIECTPPSLEITFQLGASAELLVGGEIDAQAMATFRARLGELKLRAAAILQGFAQLGALVNGKVNGELVFDPPPVIRLQAEFQGVIEAAASGEFEIAPGRIDCVIPALREAVDVLASVATETGGTISAQAEFSTQLFAIAG